MKVIKNTFKALSIAFLLIIGSAVVNAEGLPCNSKAEGLFFNTTIHPYTPVLYTTMPYDVMISYILIDSILKYAPDAKDVVNSFLKRFNNNQIGHDNDTLNYTLKYLYKIMDYDPLLFYDYIKKGYGQHGRIISPEPLYWKLITGSIHYDTVGLYDEVNLTERVTNGRIKEMIFRSLFVLHIYVDTITSYTRLNSNDSFNYTIVYSQVLDTIKGKKLPDINTAILAKRPGNDEIDTNIIIPNNVNLIFDFGKRWLYQDLQEGHYMYMLLDGVEPNKEYIVLLEASAECSHNGKCYYSLVPLRHLNFHGIYPIEDGNVIDYWNIWEWGKSVPLNTFKQNLNTIINEIKNYGE